MVCTATTWLSNTLMSWRCKPPAAPVACMAPALMLSVADDLAVASLWNRPSCGHSLFAKFSSDPFNAGGTHWFENLTMELTGVRISFPLRVTLPDAARYLSQMTTIGSFVDENGQTRMEQLALNDVGDREHDIGDAPGLFQLGHQHEKARTGAAARAMVREDGEEARQGCQGRLFEDASGREEHNGFHGSASRTLRSKHSTCPEHQTFDDIFPGFNALPDGLGMPSLPAAVSWKQQ
ncbi:unnamed protein product [Polarella glacialis]|uniref:Uncharacterized protein n=1 Tax=Polarella glacialis TaxID=89957 RepID=A0A813L7B1_POLGL|nr:unnamed protein product [Polarella glacialis]CAE8718291.1 unnamed protein product [Polarella glacialis]